MRLRKFFLALVLLVFSPFFLQLASAASGSAATNSFDSDEDMRLRRSRYSTFFTVSEASYFDTSSARQSGFVAYTLRNLRAPSVISVNNSTTPNDTFFNTRGSWGQSYKDLWGLDAIGAPLAWNSGYMGQGIKIAIVDTGVVYNQEDIAANIWTNLGEIAGNGIDDDADGYVDDIRGWDFVGNDNDASDLNGHGTHVAGIAAAVGNNSKGIIGVAPQAKIIPVRVLDQNGSGSIYNVAKGIEYAVRAGANIINLSLGASYLDFNSMNLLQKAVDFANRFGRIVVAAAGNSNANVNYFSPANLRGVIAVGATNSNDTRASFSNWGSKLFMTAPGVDILSLGSSSTHIGTTLTNDYYRASGTSMAAPYVSGAIALLLSKYPGASLSFIASKLAIGATDLGSAGWDALYGFGRLNVANSLGISPTPQIPNTVLSVNSATTNSAGSAVPGRTNIAMQIMDSISDSFDTMFPGPDMEVTDADVSRAIQSMRFVGEMANAQKRNNLEDLYQ